MSKGRIINCTCIHVGGIMRKDSELFLKKVLEYRTKINKDSFVLNCQYFKEIPNIETAINDILRDLIANDCFTSKSEVVDLEGDISINLTLDGITYFEEEKKTSSPVVFNVSGGQVNIAKGSGKIEAINNNSSNTEFAKEESLEKSPKVNALLPDNKENKIDKRVFISYSWTPESNKEWVRKLVEKLERDGVQVVIDYKDLKLGYDKYAFMERMVADETINKVLIVCNKTYKEKADSRTGGVGDESAIITPQVYGNARQEKFIPIVKEYDEGGSPYLPNYLATRMYANLVDFDKGYKELLENIVGMANDIVKKENKSDSEDISDFRDSTSFFDYRMKKAFPGVRGIKEFSNSKECVDRLEILLRSPLNKSQQGMVDPIWWFRGGSNLDINSFKRLSSTKFLMGVDEIEVKRIIVYASNYYFRKFIYVESYPEKSVGIYGEIDKTAIDKWIQQYGEYHEEYAVFKDNVITREEYDDGAAVINGQVEDTKGEAELRIRYLTPYNFIICAKWNPLNNRVYDSGIEKILNGMLTGENDINELVKLVEKLPRHKMDI